MWIDHSVHGAVTVTTAELEYQLQGLDLPQAALLVVSLRATNHAALVSTIQTSAIRVDATVPDASECSRRNSARPSWATQWRVATHRVPWRSRITAVACHDLSRWIHDF